MLEVFTSGSSKLHSSAPFPVMGLIGTYKYEGEKYEISSRVETVNKDEDSIASVKLKGFEVIVDGVKMSDQDGVVNIGRMLKSGDKIRFRITSAPESPKSSQSFFEPILNVDFTAICK